MKNTKFTQRLMQREADEELEQTEKSLRECFETKQKEEVKVERRPIQILIIGLDAVKNIICILLTVLGAWTLLHPELRHAFVVLVRTFLMEAGMGI